MNRLVKLYASNFLTTDPVLAANENLRNLVLSEENQVADEDLGIRNDTWVSLAEVEATHDTAPFFRAVKAFYEKSTKKMLEKFPFGDTLLKDLSMLQPENTSSFPFSKVVSLAKRFPSLVPRPLPAFQCCTLKSERAWYLKSRARAILLRNKQLEKGDKTNRLFFAYGAL